MNSVAEMVLYLAGCISAVQLQVVDLQKRVKELEKNGKKE